MQSNDIHLFKKYIFSKLLDLGFYIYGGAVRNMIWKSVNLDYHKRRLGSSYDTDIYNKDYDPDSYYNRTGAYTDLDCICTTNQFKIIASKEMELYGDLKYVIDNQLPYAIDADKYTIQISPKFINTQLKVKVDLLVSDNIEKVCGQIYDQLDFMCNGFCIRKINGIESMSLLATEPLEIQLSALDQFKKDYAVIKRPLDSSMYYRILKMVVYGWFTEICKISINVENYGLLTNTLLLFARKNNFMPCHLCNNTNEDIIYVKIGTRISHLSCYLTESIKLYEIIYGITYDSTTINSNTTEIHAIVLETSETNESSEDNIFISPNGILFIDGIAQEFTEEEVATMRVYYTNNNTPIKRAINKIALFGYCSINSSLLTELYNLNKFIRDKKEYLHNCRS